MDYKMFNKHKADCKKGWLELAESGNNIKPSALTRYTFACPACAITTAISLKIHGLHHTDALNCRVCPVDRWRDRALADPNSCDGEHYGGLCGCESLDPTGPFMKWKKAEAWSEAKMKLAREIADLRWTYLDVYNTTKEKGEDDGKGKTD